MCVWHWALWFCEGCPPSLPPPSLPPSHPNATVPTATTAATTASLHFHQFPVSMKNASTAAGTVRSFMDGMHDYILTHRAAAYNKLRVDLPFHPDEVRAALPHRVLGVLCWVSHAHAVS